MRRVSLFLISICLGFASCSSGSDIEEAVIPDNPDNEQGEENPNPNNSAPTIPSLVFPTNELLCTENPLGFEWEASTDIDGDGISYEIQISKNLDFTDIIENVSLSSTATTFSLEPGLEHFWRIRAKDENNEYSPYTHIWKFYMEGEGIINYLPFTPSLVSPDQNTLVSGSEVTLEWSSSDVDGDSLAYDLYFGETNPPELQTSNTDSTTAVFQIEAEKTYYWQVKAKDGNGGEVLGQIWSFKS